MFAFWQVIKSRKGIGCETTLKPSTLPAWKSSKHKYVLFSTFYILEYWNRFFNFFQTIINLCMALGFLAHGYATHEFEVTEERLGVYLPVWVFLFKWITFRSWLITPLQTEHIDNPKGYGEGEDARKYHPKLRGPVDPRELEIDHRTGMKNYIANGRHYPK